VASRYKGKDSPCLRDSYLLPFVTNSLKFSKTDTTVKLCSRKRQGPGYVFCNPFLVPSGGSSTGTNAELVSSRLTLYMYFNITSKHKLGFTFIIRQYE
jgi:hypothetical protein